MRLAEEEVEVVADTNAEVAFAFAFTFEPVIALELEFVGAVTHITTIRTTMVVPLLLHDPRGVGEGMEMTSMRYSGGTPFVTT